mgnify:CR=1 FL=1
MILLRNISQLRLYYLNDIIINRDFMSIALKRRLPHGDDWQ